MGGPSLLLTVYLQGEIILVTYPGFNPGPQTVAGQSDDLYAHQAMRYRKYNIGLKKNETYI